MRSLAQILEEYEFLDADERYRLLIELAAELDDMPQALKNRELDTGRRPHELEGGSREGAARIELADLKERIRKLEAIANGVDL